MLTVKGFLGTGVRAQRMNISRGVCTDGFSELAVVFLDWPQENVRTRKVGIHGHSVLQLLDRAVVPAGQMELPAVVRAEDERERGQILAQGAPPWTWLGAVCR